MVLSSPWCSETTGNVEERNQGQSTKKEISTKKKFTRYYVVTLTSPILVVKLLYCAIYSMLLASPLDAYTIHRGASWWTGSSITSLDVFSMAFRWFHATVTLLYDKFVLQMGWDTVATSLCIGTHVTSLANIWLESFSGILSADPSQRLCFHTITSIVLYEAKFTVCWPIPNK